MVASVGGAALGGTLLVLTASLWPHTLALVATATVTTLFTLLLLAHAAAFVARRYLRERKNDAGVDGELTNRAHFLRPARTRVAHQLA